MASEVPIDYYAVLQVLPSADRYTIRSSYIKLAKQYHPDKNANDPKATALFQSLEAAYSIIYDVEKRRAYDHQYTFTRKTMTPSISIEDLIAENRKLAEEWRNLHERLSKQLEKDKARAKKKSKRAS